MDAIETTLGMLRTFGTWQDAGELGEDPSLTGDLRVTVCPDYSVTVDGGGDLVSAVDVDDEWIAWIHRTFQEAGPLCSCCEAYGEVTPATCTTPAIVASGHGFVRAEDGEEQPSCAFCAAQVWEALGEEPPADDDDDDDAEAEPARCQCGELWGDSPCDEHLDREDPDGFRVRFVPEYLRGTAAAASTSRGCWTTCNVSERCWATISDAIGGDLEAEWYEAL